MPVLPTFSLKSILAFTILLTLNIGSEITAQVVINEGSNKNYLSYKDEDGKYLSLIHISEPTRPY